MNTTAVRTSFVQRILDRLDWKRVEKIVHDLGIAVGAFALGGWVVSIRAEEGQLPYREQATAKFEQVQKLTGSNPVAAIKCERRRANIATAVAEEAVAVSNFSATSKMVEAIPECPPSPAKN